MNNIVPNMERIIVERPDFYGQDMIKRHIDRYAWALNYLDASDSVLDLCCGTGYGAKMISEKCRGEVLGLDVNKEAIAYAKEKYENKHVKYAVEDLTDDKGLLYMMHLRFRAITLIEAIEHFDLTQAQKIILTAAKMLAPDGTLIITTPDKNQTEIYNHYHRLEYNVQELKELVSKLFNIIECKIESKFIYLVGKQNGIYNPI